MVTVEADVPDARGWHKLEDPFDHPEAGTEDWDECQFFATHTLAGRVFKWRFDFYRFKGQVNGGFIGHEHRDFVDQFLENLGWSGAIT